MTVSDTHPPRPSEPGATLGVEEEFHLVDPDTLALTPSATVAAAALAGEAGEHVHPEIVSTQLETSTGVCTTLAELRAALAATRAEAAAAAARDGLVLLAASTHPFGTWREQRLTAAPRYRDMVQRWAALADRQDICGCHVHVGVPDVGTAVAVMDRVRPYLPVLLAMTGSSPFHDGADTGYESWRTVWWSHWPNAGPPEPMGSERRFREVVDGLARSGVVADGRHLYWDVRPSARWPTLEFRLADVCTDLDGAVLHAALVRSLVRVLAGRDGPVPEVRPELLRAARWRAARDGLGGDLVDPVRGDPVGAREAVGALVAELADDLRAHGEEDDVAALLDLGCGRTAPRPRGSGPRGSPPATAAR